jgi:hypothetical protein
MEAENIIAKVAVALETYHTFTSGGVLYGESITS